MINNRDSEIRDVQQTEHNRNKLRNKKTEEAGRLFLQKSAQSMEVDGM